MASLLPTTAAASSAEPSRANSEALVRDHVRLVQQVVDRMKMTLPAHIEADDLHGAGLIGLVQASHKFDPSHGSSFAAFASSRIRGAVLDELRRMDWMSRSGRGKAKRLAASMVELEQRLGREVTEAEMARELDLSAEEYASLLDEVRPISHVELDACISEDGGETSMHELIADDTQDNACEQLLRKEMRQLAVARLQQLPDVQKKVLAMYYFEHMRLAEIAAVFGVTESRICQIHTQAVGSMRTSLRRLLAN